MSWSDCVSVLDSWVYLIGARVLERGRPCRARCTHSSRCPCQGRNKYFSGKGELATRNTALDLASFSVSCLLHRNRWLVCVKATLLCRSFETVGLLVKILAGLVAGFATVCLEIRWLGQIEKVEKRSAVQIGTRD